MQLVVYIYLIIIIIIIIIRNKKLANVKKTSL